MKNKSIFFVIVIFLLYISKSFAAADDFEDQDMKIKVFSSETSSGTIGSNILDLLGTANSRVIIASDKCTNEEFLDDLIEIYNGRNIEIKIVTGSDEETKKILYKDKYSGTFSWKYIDSNHDNSGKMHNKFIIVDESFVITGSPNLTYAAYNYNIESFVAIYHKSVPNIYILYYNYIVSDGDKYDKEKPEYLAVKKALFDFNGSDNPIKICLAPVIDVKDFIVDQLYLSESININMFIVSHAKSEKDSDIVSTLSKLARSDVAITIKVDKSQYSLGRYMRDALSDLRKDGVAVYTVSKKAELWETRSKKIKTKPQFHDKLVLIQQGNGSKKVFIGSAGFSDNVQDNLNLENMVLLFVPEIYDSLLSHFNSIDSSRQNLNVELIKK